MPTPFNNYETMRDQMAGTFLHYKASFPYLLSSCE